MQYYLMTNKNNHITKSPLENVAVHLPTQEKHDKFLRALEDYPIAYRWYCSSERPIKNNYWKEYKKEFCIIFTENNKNLIAYGNKKYREEYLNTKIISFEEAMKRLKTPITEKTFTQEEVKNLVSNAFTSGLNFGLSIKNDR
jgi:hypothetical protein